MGLRSKSYKICALAFEGKVLTLDMDPKNVPKNYLTFVISENVLLKIMENPNADKTEISVKIRNLKEEMKSYKMELGTF